MKIRSERARGIGALAASALLAGVVAVSGCKRPSPCPQRFDALAEKSARGVECTCAPNATSGSVWGNGIYTTDSAICAAAVHAGAVPASGGRVIVQALPGCPSYQGKANNDVTSAPWGAFGSSFYFPGHGTGRCTVPSAADVCPGSLGQVPNFKSLTDFACTCPAGASGTVWGDGIYTADSSICVAAVHAGAIPKTGGQVAMKPAPGCPSYSASTQHGITSAAWGSFGNSFYFPGHGDGRCVAPSPEDACPASFLLIPDASTVREHTCTCAPGATGTVYGDSIYTRDSSICGAAVHAGAVPASGGKVTVKAAPGCPSYKGSKRNGVESIAWPSYGGSFFFPSKSSGSCG